MEGTAACSVLRERGGCPRACAIAGGREHIVVHSPVAELGNAPPLRPAEACTNLRRGAHSAAAVAGAGSFAVSHPFSQLLERCVPQAVSILVEVAGLTMRARLPRRIARNGGADSGARKWHSRGWLKHAARPMGAGASGDGTVRGTCRESIGSRNWPSALRTIQPCGEVCPGGGRVTVTAGVSVSATIVCGCNTSCRADPLATDTTRGFKGSFTAHLRAIPAERSDSGSAELWVIETEVDGLLSQEPARVDWPVDRAAPVDGLHELDVRQ